ncbi:DgyrCDS10428 [Dimorphilus gyrociliatus]|uniref:DgyrCDS10428 n=1 Tax=Dimorphilus gyrociliatus TaxID=2664684 RepID=A0A7I8W0C9_9ANNE|nr:DgyrCDS10428 [Dimorphilus gyrociliatus]
MRPDHHKKRKNYRYKKAHGIVDQKEESTDSKETTNNKSKKTKSNKKPKKPEKKPIEKVPENDKEKEKNDDDPKAEGDESEAEDFRKREICSNWSKYEEPSSEEVEDEEDEDDDYSDDDFDLQAMIDKGTKKFQVEENKSWVREMEEKDAEPLNLDDFNKEFFEEEADREFIERAKLDYESKEETTITKEEPDELDILLRATESTIKEADNNDIDDLLNTLAIKSEPSKLTAEHKHPTRNLINTNQQTMDDFLDSLDKVIDS